ncbi:MAG: SAF domain-containing protein [Actinobacteria bacterium]|nr:SAF domain-containing protein [Actinomycetota bacterium]
MLIVDRPIPAGTDGVSAVAYGLLRLDRMPREFTPDDAVIDPASLIGLITAVALTPGQVVTTEAFEPA